VLVPSLITRVETKWEQPGIAIVRSPEALASFCRLVVYRGVRLDRGGLALGLVGRR
jgi:hypothetical protein